LTAARDPAKARAVAALPEAVRLLAEFPLTHGPEPPAAAPVQRIQAAGCSIFLAPGPNSQSVEPVEPADVAVAVEEVRALLRERDRFVAIWFVSPSARPSDLLDRLWELGLSGAGLPSPWEPRYAAMALTEPPAPGPADVVARRPESFEEFDAAIELEAEIVGIPEEDRRASREHRRVSWELHQSDIAVIRVFVALIDGEIVGLGRAVLADAGVNLGGGSVRPDMRSRGIYRALVRARWEMAAERGTPALTVQAGRMSRPILERLGFETVGRHDCLVDRFDHVRT
jgi:GNAT superfamily N-acetyltransferase